MSALFTFWTVVVGVVFLGIAVWAYSGRRRDEFDAAARIPLEDEHGDDRSTRANEDG